MLKAERLERAYTLFARQRVIIRLTMEDRGRIFRDEQAWLRHLASFPQENPNPVVEVDASGALVYANPAALRLFPDLPAEGSRHPLLAGLGRYALEMKIPGAGSLAFEAEVRGAVYRLDVSVPRPGEGLRVYATDITEQKRAEEAVIKSREELRGVVEHAGDAFFIHDLEGNILDINRRACESLGYTREELLSLSVKDVEQGFSPADMAELWDRMEPGRPITVDGVHRRRDGVTFPVEVRLGFFEARGRRLMLALARDVSERKEAEELLLESERRFRQLFEQSVEALILHDERGNVVDCNTVAHASLGYTREEMLALSVEDFVVHLLSEEEKEEKGEDTPWRRALGGGPAGVSFHENEHRRKDGSTFPVEVGISAIDYGGRRLILASCRDITERKVLEEALAHRASHDPLTGLANRDLFEERVRQALARAARHGRKAAVLFVDLDDFKGVNDAFGHRVGDRLLEEVAGRLKDGVRIEDTVGRLGGDEFVVLLEDLAREDEALLVARRVGEMLRPPFVLGGRTLAVTASIGAALGPSGGDPLGQDLISEADAAMYRAKQSGKDRQELFRPT
jgi:diguanylate cyclase (GGDEF)-like protein/PAS domain S-box-containing protein